MSEPISSKPTVTYDGKDNPLEKAYPVVPCAGASWSEDCEAFHDSATNNVHVRPKKAGWAPIDVFIPMVDHAAQQPRVEVVTRVALPDRRIHPAERTERVTEVMLVGTPDQLRAIHQRLGEILELT